MDLSQYALDTIRQDSELELCRGRLASCTDPDSPSILVSISRYERPGPERVRMLEHELALKSELDSRWAVRPVALAQHQGRVALIFEDPGGKPLDQIFDATSRSSNPAMDLGLFLRLAVGLADALGEVHRRGIIHKNIKPAHVHVNAATGHVWLTGFGIASRLPRERQDPRPPETIAGTLAYMAPEQTGRMNRSIDTRSDLYALGVTLYETLTGTLPFTAADPMEWVHCHIARQAKPPSELVKHVPPPLSAIIMKLLAKTAEDRYQTAAGLKHDLQRCLAQFETDGRIDDFALAEHDTPDRLMIQEKLYGRARAIEILLGSFNAIVEGGAPELVLVSGYSGIGKSSVVNELHKVLVPPRGLLAAGKFEQYKRDIPYATLAEALQKLIRPLLAKNDLELVRWREALREALGPNGQLMVDLVPDLKLVIGDQAPVLELPAQDAQRRFQTVFRRFLGVFARPDHPLALFLDDLQWLDAATLDLLEDLLTQGGMRHLLLIGAFRDNEVTSAHPLMRTLERIRTSGVSVRSIVLAPLAEADVVQLVAESLNCSTERAAPLAGLVHDKTAGNPFFVIQFLSTLVEEGLVKFDHGSAHWTWDLARIRAKGFTDNVVDLMVGKLLRLPSGTQRTLQQLACLGNSAELALLETVHDGSEENLLSDLLEARRTGLVFESDGSYHFLHDRVQEAAYCLTPEAERAEAHLRIGRLLVAGTSFENREEAIFEIVNQLNRGAGLIVSTAEKEQLAELNLEAGRRAKGSTAYASALSYLATGAAFLSTDGSQRWSALRFALELQRAECEFLTGDLVTAEARLTTLASYAAEPRDQATVACLRIDLYTTLDRSDHAVEIGLAYLRHRGIEWSPHPTEDEARGEYERTWSLLGRGEIEECLDLPLMSDPDIEATMDVLTKALTPALFTDAHLLSLLTCRMVNLSLEHGNTEASCYAYVWLGMIAGPRFGHYETGFRFGRLGYDLVGRHGFKRSQARVYMSFGVLIIPWTQHVRTGQELIRRAFNIANSIGDLTTATYCCNDLIGNLLTAGDPLADVQREAEQGLEFVTRARFGLSIAVIATQLALIRTLRGHTTLFGCLDDAHFNERQVEHRLSRDPGLAIAACWYWVRKLQARFLAGDYVSALDASSKAHQLLWTSPSFLETAEAHFYGALSHAACCNAAMPDQYQRHVEALTAHHRQLVAWAESCPENFETRAALVGAEISRIEGRELDAERLYEAAIKSAREGNFVHNEALANELAARFYSGRGFETIAHAYLRNARYSYLRWGADGKVRQLDQLYPHLTREDAVAAPTGTMGATLEQLDLATVIKVAQAVSGEVVLERLLDTLMRTAMEHAGAERALLMLSRGSDQRIVAEATTSADGVIVQLLDEPVTSPMLPETIVRYVTHTQESVVLDDAASRNAFSADPYIEHRRVRSVLCLPLSNQARLIGVLYLENRLAPLVFAPTRTAVLKLLASQAAISLENTRLYRDLADRESEFRLIVESIPGLVALLAATGELEVVNRQIHAYTGRTFEELRQWGTNDIVHPEDLPGLIDTFTGAITSGSPYDITQRLRRFDGVYRWFRNAGCPVRDADGRIVRWCVLLTDIDDQKRAEDTIRASEHNLKLTIDTIPALAWSARPNGNAEFFSQHYLDFIGLSMTQAQNSGWMAAVHPEDLAGFAATWQRIIFSAAPGEAEARLRRHDGEYRWFLFRANPLRDENGLTVKWYGVNTDIEDRRRAEAELRRSRTFLAEAQTLSRTGSFGAVAAVDEHLWSDETYRIFEYDPSTRITMPLILERVHPEDVSLAERNLALARNAESFECAVRLLMPSGALKHVRIVGHGARGRDDRLDYIGAIQDVTQQRLAEEALNRARSELAHVSRVTTLSALTASIAHEVNQPLSGIITNSGTCLRMLNAAPPDIEGARETVVRTIRDGNRASEVITRLRALFSKREFTLEALDLNEAVREIVAISAADMQHNHIALRSELADNLPIVSGDRVQLQQVILNLVRNASDAMVDVHDRPRSMLIKTEREDREHVRVTVRDAGAGLSPQILDSLFDPFHTTKIGGMGIGLFVSRSIVERHHGRLWAEPNQGSPGATFSFSIPWRVEGGAT